MQWNPETGRSVLVVCLMVTMITAGSVWADVPHMINYQGYMTDSIGTPLDTTVSVQFYIYNASFLGTQLWTETHSSVEVERGLFNVILGSVAPIGPHVFNGDDRWLAMAIGDDPIGKPRTKIVSQAYSYHSRDADTADYAENSAHSLHADTAEYALNSTGGSGGWVDAGSVVRLSSSGDLVGIGTSTPEEKLHVEGHMMLGTDFDIKFGTSGSQINPSGTDLIVDAGDDLHLQPADNIYIRQGTDPTFITIDPGSRNMGIGTASPLDMVHIVNDASGGSAFLRVEANHATNWHEAGVRIETPQNRWHLRMDDDLNNQIPDGALGLRSQDAALEVMTWKENGYIGIGETDPDRKLCVNGNTLVDGDLRVYGTMYASVVTGSIQGSLLENSVTSGEILNEAGLRTKGVRNLLSVGTGWTGVISESVYVPRGGNILVLVSSTITADHGATGYTSCYYGISDDNDSIPVLQQHWFHIPSAADAGDYEIPATIHRVFPISSGGTYTFYLLAKKSPDNTVYFWRRDMTLLYVPTTYEASSQPPPVTTADDIGARSESPGQISVAGLSNQIEALKRRIEILEGR